MFKPTYRITERLLSILEKAAAISSKISESNLQLSTRIRLEKEAARRNTHSSTSIEGNRLNLEQVSAISENRDVRADSRQKGEVANYLKAIRWVFRSSHRGLDEKKLLKLHILILQGLAEDKKIGRYKTKQNHVMDGRGRIVYTPPSPTVTPRLVRELLTWVYSGKKVHPVIASAVFHHQLVSIHPFSDGNGRVARLTAQWILYRRGFDPWHFFSVDDFYAGDRDRYYAMIQQARDLDGDLTYWIEYVAEGLLNTCEKVYERILVLSRSFRVRITVTPKQEKLLGILREQSGINSNRLGKQLKVNRARVHQLVTPLLKAGIVRREGLARAARYYLAH